MDLTFLIIGIVLLLVGLAGTVIPVLPGAPLAWGGLLVAFFSSYTDYSIICLIVTGVFAVLVSIMDNIFPVLMTKKTNGSPAATRGATVGLIIGFFTGPWGIILGPFIGALIGEMIHNPNDFSNALKVAWGAFLGFLFGTGIKIITVLAFIWILIINLVK